MKNKEKINEILWHNKSVKEIATILNSDINLGISESEVEARRENYGENKIVKAKKFS